MSVWADHGDSRPLLEKLLSDQAALAELNQAMSRLFAGNKDIDGILTDGARLLAGYFDGAAVRIWTFSDRENILELRGAAGLPLPSDGRDARISLGIGVVGTIGERRAAIVTNDIANDPLLQKIDTSKNFVGGFAGYPLIVEDTLAGVMCVFSGPPLSRAGLKALAAISDNIANTIGRKELIVARRKLIERLHDARESERRHLSRYLHDDVAQQLAVASMRLHRLERNILALLPDEHSLIADVVVAQELICRNQQAMRQIGHSLHLGILEDLGLAEALRGFAEDLNVPSEQRRTNISLTLPDSFPRLDLAVETGIYRIIQEAVINAVKYARADKISVKLTLDGDTVTAAVVDDGCGFDTKITGGTGIGLSVMRERAEIMGAKLKITSRIQKGTSISIEAAFEERMSNRTTGC